MEPRGAFEAGYWIPSRESRKATWSNDPALTAARLYLIPSPFDHSVPTLTRHHTSQHTRDVSAPYVELVDIRLPSVGQTKHLALALDRA